MQKHTLEPAARAFADATAQPPFLYELGPDGARKVLDDLQAENDVLRDEGEADAAPSTTSSCSTCDGSDAYIHVRVPNGPRPDGSIVVYLPNGTGLVVNNDQLMHLDAGENAPGASDGRTD